MSIFTGSGVAVCTPFDNEGKFNCKAYEELINFQINAGTDAIISCGTTGEAPTLSKDEHIEIVRQAAAITNKRVPVIAGAGGNDTAKCIEMGKALTQAGADALMYATPYYNKTSQKGLVQHYTAIAAAVDVPIVVYNVPSRTGMSFTVDTYLELAKHPNINLDLSWIQPQKVLPFVAEHKSILCIVAEIQKQKLTDTNNLPEHIEKKRLNMLDRVLNTLVH